MSSAEILAPVVAFPTAVFFLWLLVSDFSDPKRRATTISELKSDPVGHICLYLAVISMVLFLVWIGTLHTVGRGEVGIGVPLFFLLFLTLRKSKRSKQ